MRQAGQAGRRAFWLGAAVAIAATPHVRAQSGPDPIAFSDIDFDPPCRPNEAFERALATLADLNRQVLAGAAPAVSRYGTVSGEASLRMRFRDRVD